jgi:uncharacterized protein (TIGR03067 family)
MLPTVVLALAVAAPAIKDKAKPAPPSIVGTWVVESVVVGGQARPDPNPERWTFNADGTRTAGPGDTVTRRGTYTIIDPKATPLALDLTAQPSALHLCIFRIDGDTLTLNLGNVGDARPTTFESPAGTKHVLRVFKRVRTDGGKP